MGKGEKSLYFVTSVLNYDVEESGARRDGKLRVIIWVTIFPTRSYDGIVSQP